MTDAIQTACLIAMGIGFVGIIIPALSWADRIGKRIGDRVFGVDS